MDISSLTGLIPTSKAQQNINRSNDRLQAAVASLVSGTRLNQAADDIAALTVASQLQSNISTLRQAGGNLAQAFSLASVADGGIEQIGNALTRMNEIATQANSGALNDAARKGLNEEFQSLAKEIDRLAANTQFNGRALLDGTVQGNNAVSLDGLLAQDGEGSDALSTLTISDLSTSGLFGSANLNVLSQQDAQNAIAVLGTAFNRIISARAEVGGFQSAVSFASANIESAIFNQEAARSTLADTDFAAGATELTQALLQQNAGIATAAQGNRLAPALLSLIA